MKQKLAYTILAATIAVGGIVYVTNSMWCIFPGIFGGTYCFDTDPEPCPKPKSIEPHPWPGDIGDETPR